MMRSELVFGAVTTLRNRYMLCQLASKATRKFHKPNTRVGHHQRSICSYSRFRTAGCNRRAGDRL